MILQWHAKCIGNVICQFVGNECSLLIAALHHSSLYDIFPMTTLTKHEKKYKLYRILVNHYLELSL